ncbi:MAG: hypothetical protein Q8N88_02895 [Nanoarchaeota archaeon]|nr:hypothetical protein [Nanoarchaeota archaeon]
MEQMIKKKEIARSPTLQTVQMVEEFIHKNSGEFGKTNLFHTLPKKMLWPTFQVIIEYLQSINKIIIDDDGKIVWIWNPNLIKQLESKNLIAK